MQETSEYPRGVELVAAAIIVNSKGEILLVGSPKWGNTHVIPGGHVEPGESLMAAAKREGEEETGLLLQPQYCVGFGELVADPEYHRKAHLVFVHFICKSLTDEVKIDGTEVKTYIWISVEDALKQELASGIKESIERYRDNQRIEVASYIF